MPKINEFQVDLKYSTVCSDEDFWKKVYQDAFPTFCGMKDCSGDMSDQRLGIDRRVLLQSGQVLKVDEKKRRKDWGDILLEYISNDKTMTPGWIEKDLKLDYIAYAFMQSKRCYLFPWPLLRRAWSMFDDTWIAYGVTRRYGFRLVEAKNPTYTTISVAVPASKLYSAINDVAVIDANANLFNSFDFRG